MNQRIANRVAKRVAYETLQETVGTGVVEEFLNDPDQDFQALCNADDVKRIEQGLEEIVDRLFSGAYLGDGSDL